MVNLGNVVSEFIKLREFWKVLGISWGQDQGNVAVLLIFL